MGVRAGKWMALAAGASAGMFMLTGCAGSAAGQANTSSKQVSEIVIGALHPKSGANAADGQQMSNAAQMAVDSVNEAGGIAALGGAKLKLESADTQGKPEVGQSEATRLIGDGAVALVGTFQSATSSNVASVAERNKVPFVMDVSSLDNILQQGYKYSFRLQANASAMGVQSAQNLIQLGKEAGTPVKQVAFLFEQGNFGQATLKTFQEEAAKQGVKVDPAISYDASSVSDMTTQVSQVAASGADVLAVAGYYRDSSLVAQAVNTLKPNIKAVFGVANGAYDQPQFVKDAPNGGDKYFDSNYHWDATNAKANELAAKYKEKYGETIRTSAVLTYDAVKVIAQALEDAKTTDKSKLRDAIAATHYEPLMVANGPVAFSATGENTNAALVTMQIQGGTVKQVFPEKLAEAKYIFPAFTGK